MHHRHPYLCTWCWCWVGSRLDDPRTRLRWDDFACPGHQKSVVTQRLSSMTGSYSISKTYIYVCINISVYIHICILYTYMYIIYIYTIGIIHAYYISCPLAYYIQIYCISVCILYFWQLKTYQHQGQIADSQGIARNHKWEWFSCGFIQCPGLVKIEGPMTGIPSFSSLPIANGLNKLLY